MKISSGVLLLALAGGMQAAPVVFNAAGTNSASGNALSASASFDIVGTTLTVVLTNNNNISVPSDVLIALMWDMGTNTASLTGFDADVTSGSTPFPQDLDATGGNSEWKFAQSAAGLAGITQHYGVGTAGLGIFGGGGGQQFNWGLSNGLSGDANPAVSGGTFIDNSATFTFTLPSGFTGSISNVRFQFGTALDEPSIICSTPECTPSNDETPEPATFGVMGVALGALAALWRKRS